jgi:hypothetical protein
MKRTARLSALILGTLALTMVDASAGQFKPAVYYNAGQPYALVAAQLTNSGNLDLVVADYATGQIFILLGKGDGTFQKPINFPFPNPVALAVGDFNGDGQEDLAVIECGGTGESAVVILLGDGTGKFRKSASYPSGVETTGVAVADFNGDGHSDVAVANNSGNVMVFFGTGKGTLRKPAIYKLPGANPYGLAAGDLNGDGHPDLAVAEASGGSVAVLLNDGTGHFLKPVTYKAGGGEVLDVKIADLRNDGRQDLVIANLSQGMVVLLNKGNGTFGKPTIYTPTFFNWQPPGSLHRRRFQSRRQARRSVRRSPLRRLSLLRQRRRHVRNGHCNSGHDKQPRRFRDRLRRLRPRPSPRPRHPHSEPRQSRHPAQHQIGQLPIAASLALLDENLFILTSDYAGDETRRWRCDHDAGRACFPGGPYAAIRGRHVLIGRTV